MTEQYYECSIPHKKTSTIPIEIESTDLIILVNEINTFSRC